MSTVHLKFHGRLSDTLRTPDAARLLFERSTTADAEVRATTRSIVESVRAAGDAALRSLAVQFDSTDLRDIEVPADEMQHALGRISPELRTAMQRAATNIRRAHAAGVPVAHEVETEPGITVGRRPDPYSRIGVYAPGGRATYPSSVLMGAIPARVAGVGEVILCSPPSATGLPSDVLMAAAALAQVDRVFAVGGAGAIAAMAFGTESVPAVQKIVGPGNAYVAEAKLQVAGFVAIDSPAGPSELLVIADDATDPAVVAREMLAQAEHDPHAVVIAVLTSRDSAAAVLEALSSLAAGQPRREVICAALRDHGAVLWCDSLDETIGFTNSFAPEHLLIATQDPDSVCARVRNSGTIFLGPYSSVAFGDYMTGSNHVLPTGALARSYSGLSTLDFVRWTSYQRITRSAARAISADVATFATAEELHGHAAAARAWMEDN